MVAPVSEEAPRVALLVIGDGRDRLQVETLQSFARAVGAKQLGNLIVAKVTVDDRQHALGFCGAIQAGWAELRRLHEEEPFDYVFHLEEDWAFNRPLDLAAMARCLDLRRDHAEPPILAPDLAQISLRRNAVNSAEITAGGLVELWPDEYLDTSHGDGTDGGELHYLEHALYFTTNPSLYRYSLLAHPWPNPPGCEREFTEQLLERGYHFAVWGERGDEPWITHTGHRTGRGY